MRGYKWLDRRLAELDPHTQYHEIVRLFGEYRLNEFLLNIGYTLSFMDVSMPPHGAKGLVDGGRASLDHPQERFEGSLYFFWSWYLYPSDSDQVKRSMRRLNGIHAGAAKTAPGSFTQNADYVQGMSLLALVFHRLQRLAGLPGFPAHLRIALHNWTRDLSALLTAENDVPVTDFPADFDAMAALADSYDEHPWRRTDNGHAVSEAFIQQFCDRWFPAPLKPMARTVVLTMIPENVRHVMQLDDPHPIGAALVRTGLRVMFTVQGWLPDPRTPIYRRRIGKRDSPALKRLKETGGRTAEPAKRAAARS